MEDSGQTRARILAATLRLLGEEGADAFSAAALARETGISKANVFHHFPRLEEIPLAALETLAEQMTASSVTAKAKDLHPWLIELGQEVFDTVANNRAFLNAYFVFFSKALFDERLRAPLRRCVEHAKAMIEARLVLELHREDASAVAALTATMLDGLVMRLLALEERATADRIWSNFVDLVTSRSGQL